MLDYTLQMQQVREAFSLAEQLFDSTEEAEQWMLEPNHIFFNVCPLECIMSGYGKSVLGKLQEWSDE